MKPIEDIVSILRASKPSWAEPLTASLANEADPDGAIVIRDREGTEVARMSQTVYRALMTQRG